MEISMETIKKLQKIELEILKVFIQICEKEKLCYYLSGGTLLGAVRHKGFIPWDDDIDVRMPRADYEKFLLCAPKYLPDYYFLQTHNTEKESPWIFAKIRDRRTIYKEYETSDFNINHGVWIDIFPLDYYFHKPFWLDLYHRFLRFRIGYRLKIKQSLIKRILRGISCILCPSWNKAVEKQQNLIRSGKNTSLLTNFNGGKKDIMPTSWYGSGVDLIFEKIKVKGPNEYEKYLTQLYGNYMQLPPKDKRVPVHNILEIKL